MTEHAEMLLSHQNNHVCSSETQWLLESFVYTLAKASPFIFQIMPRIASCIWWN